MSRGKGEEMLEEMCGEENSRIGDGGCSADEVVARRSWRTRGGSRRSMVALGIASRFPMRISFAQFVKCEEGNCNVRTALSSFVYYESRIW
jgi:hypothetical protein